MAELQDYQIELLVMDGAAIALLYDARQSTRDIDALMLAPQAPVVRVLAQVVAREYDLPDDWLNDGAKGYLVGVSWGEVIVEAPGITAHSPSTAQLLSMKISAWRDDVDVGDARQLLGTMEGSQQEVWEAVQPYLVSGAQLKAEYAFLDL